MPALNAKDRSTLNLPPDKHCPRCENTKVSDDFHLDKKEKDGLKWACKTCVRDMNRLVTQKTLAYKPFSALLQQILTENDNRKLLQLVNKVFATATSDHPAAVSAQKILIERLEGKLKEEVAITADQGTVQLISDANDLLKRIKNQPEPELMIPVQMDSDKRTLN